MDKNIRQDIQSIPLRHDLAFFMATDPYFWFDDDVNKMM